MSLVDADTGEIVERRPVVSTPSAPMTALDIANQCRSVEVWAESCTSVEELREAGHRMAAIDEYVQRTSSAGRAKIAATMRRLEVRIGQLLGPAPTPQESGAKKGSSAIEPSPLTKDERSQFRKMADHPDLVDAVIDDSDDESPASRRRVLDEINRAKQAPRAEPTPEEQRAAEHVAHIGRCRARLEKFHDGWPQFAGLRDHPDRAEILAALTPHDRQFVLDLETELFA